MIPHVTDHVTSPTAHATVSHTPSHFDSQSAGNESDNLGHGDAARDEGVDDADSCHGYSVAEMHKPAETACPHTYYPSLVIQNASRGIPGAYYVCGAVALPPASEY